MRPRVRALAAALALLALLSSSTARAEEDPSRHAWFGAGSLSIVPGFEFGAWLGGGVSGRRWGVRLDAAVIGTAADQGFVAAEVTWTGGRMRRHLVIDLRAGVGVAWPESFAVGLAGVASRWGLQKRGPLFIGIDGGVLLRFQALPVDPELVTIISFGAHW
jgi:hypothetical protein